MVKIVNKDFIRFTLPENGNFADFLDIYTKYVATLINSGIEDNIRRWQYAVRDAQGGVKSFHFIQKRVFKSTADYKGEANKYCRTKKVTVNNRVAVCSKYPIDKNKLISIREKEGRHSFHNLMACGSVWLCSVCSHRILKQRQNELTAIFEILLDSGLKLNMITLTVPHTFAQPQKEVINLLLSSWRKLVQSPQMKEFNKVSEYWIRATEARFGLNGIHPHFHIVCSSEASGVLAEANKLIAKWCEITGASRDAQMLSKYENTDYVFESVKEINKYKGELAGQYKIGSSIDCMHLAIIAPDKYTEYAEAIRGTKRLQGSKLFTELLKDGLTDNEILHTAVSEFDIVKFQDSVWSTMKHQSDLKAQIIGLLNQKDEKALKQKLKEYGYKVTREKTISIFDYKKLTGTKIITNYANHKKIKRKGNK